MATSNKPVAEPTPSQPAKPAKPPTPAWAWLFAAACALIPILSLGGALPGAIGIGGAGGCIGVARDAGKSVGLRVGICVAITAVCWALFAGLLVLMASARR